MDGIAVLKAPNSDSIAAGSGGERFLDMLRAHSYPTANSENHTGPQALSLGRLVMARRVASEVDRRRS
jgi:hypothetical protein